MNIIKKTCTNFYKGRSGFQPEIIVLHIMDGTLAGTDSWFAAPASKVSAHYGVGLKGEVHQYVEDVDTAWANGNVASPSFALLKPGVNPNSYTLSIENEGHDLALAPKEQLEAICELIKTLASKWKIPIDRDHVIGHYQIDAKKKPNCPAIDKSIIDTIVKRCQGGSLSPTDKEKVAKAIEILNSILI